VAIAYCYFVRHKNIHLLYLTISYHLLLPLSRALLRFSIFLWLARSTACPAAYTKCPPIVRGNFPSGIRGVFRLEDFEIHLSLRNCRISLPQTPGQIYILSFCCSRSRCRYPGFGLGQLFTKHNFPNFSSVPRRGILVSRMARILQISVPSFDGQISLLWE
jgi:hypothetical protein